MPRAQAWMASLFDVSVRPPEPTDQEISEALLSTREILRGVQELARASGVARQSLTLELKGSPEV